MSWHRRELKCGPSLYGGSIELNFDVQQLIAESTDCRVETLIISPHVRSININPDWKSCCRVCFNKSTLHFGTGRA